MPAIESRPKKNFQNLHHDHHGCKSNHQDAGPQRAQLVDPPGDGDSGLVNEDGHSSALDQQGGRDEQDRGASLASEAHRILTCFREVRRDLSAYAAG